MQETQVQSLCREDLLEKAMATHSSILCWKIPWTEEPGGLQSMRSQRVGQDWATNTNTQQCVHVKKKKKTNITIHEWLLGVGRIPLDVYILLCLFKNLSLEHNNVVFCDPSSRVWLGLNSGFITYYLCVTLGNLLNLSLPRVSHL